jgi:hypothetical protein
VRNALVLHLQETSKLTLSKLCSSEPEGSSDSSTRTSSSKGVLSGERVQEYARLLSLLVKMHAPQVSDNGCSGSSVARVLGQGTTPDMLVGSLF